MKYFGTDGIRGRVNSKHINGDMFFKFGLAAGKYFTNLKKKKQTAIIAKDTRLSGYTLEPALVSGLTSAGMHVFTMGPMPTNALAMLTKSMNANLGIMITASHNQFYDNGLKLFGPDGLKLSNKIENKIEKLIDKDIKKHLTDNTLLGRVKRLESGTDNYIRIIKKRINKNCGSTYPQILQKKVKQYKADLGISFDGDADRIIMCDEKGTIIDGDQIIAAIAMQWKKKKILKGGVVGTLMSNYGLEKFFKQKNIKFIRANVGDKYVKELMQKYKFNLGGEQSGHIILGKYATTGDGLLVALEAVKALNGKMKASTFFNVFKKTPQILENVKCKKENILNDPKVKKVIRLSKEKIKGQGRILVRKSGTEPLIRVMGESDNINLLKIVLKKITQKLL